MFIFQADNVAENQRASLFGILSGIGSFAFVCGNLSTRFLSTSSALQVSASMAVLATLYMIIFLPESIKQDNNHSLSAKLIEEADSEAPELNLDSCRNKQLFKGLASLGDIVSLLKTSSAFSLAAIVAFFNNLGDVGFHTVLLYYLKARFGFNKNQFADLMVIGGVAGTTSQLLLMPLLIPAVGEEKLLSIGLLCNCVYMILYSIAWSSWVPYVAPMFCVFIVFSNPCIQSIASKQVGLNEQGKAQGCISGISSFANVISPLAFTPLTALFLSEGAPFYFPGFSIMCLGFLSMVAFIQSLMIRASQSMSGCGISKCSLVE